MSYSSVVIGVGQIGSVLSHGLLRLGHTVHPVTRQLTVAEQATHVPEPELVVVAVGESELDGVLAQLPPAWKAAAVLVQNELLPPQWERHAMKPTMNVVWFEKKRHTPIHVVLPSVVRGPKEALVATIYEALNLPVEVAESDQALLLRMIEKNLYILTVNLAGLETGGTTGDLWQHHRSFAARVANDVLDLQESLVGVQIDRDAAIRSLVRASEADPQHTCTGRSAPHRLARALRHAEERAVDLPTLRKLADKYL